MIRSGSLTDTVLQDIKRRMSEHERKKNMYNKDNSLNRVMGLWENTSKNGDKYLSGSLNQSVRVMVMKNRYKESKSDPDYVVYFTPNTKGSSKPAPQATGGSDQKDKDEIPF